MTKYFKLMKEDQDDGTKRMIKNFSLSSICKHANKTNLKQGV